MNARGERLELCLLSGAEALLLVDHDQPKLLKSDSLGGKRIGANDNAKAALRERLPHGPGLGGLHEARQMTDLDPGCGKAVAERLKMLAHQDRGRGDDRHLLAGS